MKLQQPGFTKGLKQSLEVFQRFRVGMFFFFFCEVELLRPQQVQPSAKHSEDRKWAQRLGSAWLPWPKKMDIFEAQGLDPNDGMLQSNAPRLQGDP